MQNRNKQIKNSLNYNWRAADSRTEPVSMNFLRATIEALSHGLSDELLKTTPVKSIKLESRSEPTHLEQ